VTSKELTQSTISHYAHDPESYRLGTQDHDVSQNYRALLGAMPGEGPYKILDMVLHSCH